MKSWRERVIAARKYGKFTPDDKARATRSWLTCAVGEQQKLHPELSLLQGRGSDAQPYSVRLTELGTTSCADMGFGWAVLTDNIGLAERRLEEIEDAVLELKRKGAE